MLGEGGEEGRSSIVWLWIMARVEAGLPYLPDQHKCTSNKNLIRQLIVC